MHADDENINSRIEALEIKSAYQEDTIEKLNSVIIEQEARIASSEQKISLLIDKLKEFQPEAGTSFNQQELPPHY